MQNFPEYPVSRQLNEWSLGCFGGKLHFDSHLDARYQSHVLKC
jgi:hypothetical protein